MFCPKCGNEMTENEGIFMCYDESHATYCEEAMDWFGEVVIYGSSPKEFWYDGETFEVDMPEQLLLSIRKLAEQFDVRIDKPCPFLKLNMAEDCKRCPLSKHVESHMCFVGHMKRLL